MHSCNFLVTEDIARARARAHLMLGMVFMPHSISYMGYLSLCAYNTYILISHIRSTAYVRQELARFAAHGMGVLGKYSAVTSDVF